MSDHAWNLRDLAEIIPGDRDAERLREAADALDAKAADLRTARAILHAVARWHDARTTGTLPAADAELRAALGVVEDAAIGDAIRGAVGGSDTQAATIATLNEVLEALQEARAQLWAMSILSSIGSFPLPSVAAEWTAERGSERLDRAYGAIHDEAAEHYGSIQAMEPDIEGSSVVWTWEVLEGVGQGDTTEIGPSFRGYYGDHPDFTPEEAARLEDEEPTEPYVGPYRGVAETLTEAVAACDKGVERRRAWWTAELKIRADKEASDV